MSGSIPKSVKFILDFQNFFEIKSGGKFEEFANPIMELAQFESGLLKQNTFEIQNYALQISR